MGYKDMPPGGTTAKLERRRTPPNAVIFAPFSAFSKHVFCSPKALAKSDDVTVLQKQFFPIVYFPKGKSYSIVASMFSDSDAKRVHQCCSGMPQDPRPYPTQQPMQFQCRKPPSLALPQDPHMFLLLKFHQFLLLGHLYLTHPGIKQRRIFIHIRYDNANMICQQLSKL